MGSLHLFAPQGNSLPSSQSSGCRQSGPRPHPNRNQGPSGSCMMTDYQRSHGWSQSCPARHSSWQESHEETNTGKSAGPWNHLCSSPPRQSCQYGSLLDQAAKFLSQRGGHCRGGLWFACTTLSGASAERHLIPVVQLEMTCNKYTGTWWHLINLEKHQMNVDLNDMTSHREPKKAGQSNKLAQPTKTIRLWQTPMPKILRMSTNSIALLAGWLFGCRRLS